ncbi:glycoside hydrolase family 16 protein, partial [Marinobacterium sp. xm-a-152]|uniref:glycoside hydrolase family 16 protein n=1 Tax=Marinobacterium sp. xm-a-152 TaxID=2497733 RepID=UPI0015688D19
MAAHQSLAQQIQELKLKQTAGTLSAEELQLLNDLEIQLAEDEMAAEEDLKEISDSAATGEASLSSLPDVGFVLPAAGAGLALAAGGAGGAGGGGGGTPVISLTAQQTTGQLVNGYIEGARVFRDTNDNGRFDEGESFGITDSSGAYTLTEEPSATGSLIAEPLPSTVDKSTLEVVTSTFSAPSGSSVITPLTTLLDNGLTQTQLKAALGLNGSEYASLDILSYDPLDILRTGATNPTAALALKSAAVQVANIMDVAGNLTDAAGASADGANLVAAALATSLAANTLSSTLGNSGTIQTILNDVANDAGITLSASQNSSIVSASAKLAESNTLIQAQSSNTSDISGALTQLAQLEKSVQATLSSRLSNAIENDTAFQDYDVSTDAAGQDIGALFGVVEDLLLFSSETPNDDLSTLFTGVTPFDSQSTFNFTSASDPNEVYTRVGSITSGNGYGAQVALAAFPQIGVGFAEEYSALNFKVTNTPTGNIEVKLFSTGNADSVKVIDLDTYANSEDLGNGWFDVSIPMSELSAQDNISSHSGLLLAASDDTAESPFTIYFTDISMTGGNAVIEGTYVDTVIPDGYSLVFEDDFTDIGGQPDASNWSFDIGDDGWGNGESQDYQSDLDDAVIVADPDEAGDGVLKIIANKTGETITSARVKSTFDSLDPYGYFEVRAKLPSEEGAWPAIWLLGQEGREGWPLTGEIDLVEWSSASSDEIAGTDISSAIHTQSGYAGGADVGYTTLSSAVDNWHTYQLWWTPDSIHIGVDGTLSDAHLVYERPADATVASWPFDNPMDIILNIAIGGTLGGSVPTTDFNYEMLVDYVRIYQDPAMHPPIISPQTAAPVPSVDDTVAISLYSDALTDDGVVTNFNPGWGQNGSL